ncbi:MAG: TIR domain-containing protein [Candidatus Thorarchaeota archaeon]
MTNKLRDLGLLSLLVVAGKLIHNALRIKKVFVSFDYSEDVNLRNLLEAWTKNSHYNFSMHRTSPMKAIQSDDEAVVKRALTPMMKNAEYLLVIVGRETVNSKFVEWEIERAMQPDANLKIAAVKRHPHCKLPPLLRQGRSSWSPNFTVEGIKKALNGAKRIH